MRRYAACGRVLSVAAARPSHDWRCAAALCNPIALSTSKDSSPGEESGLEWCVCVCVCVFLCIYVWVATAALTLLLLPRRVINWRARVLPPSKACKGGAMLLLLLLRRCLMVVGRNWSVVGERRGITLQVGGALFRADPFNNQLDGKELAKACDWDFTLVGLRVFFLGGVFGLVNHVVN